MKHDIKLSVNGEQSSISVESNETLLDVIREKLYLTGTKKGCDTGSCGACTVFLRGKPVSSCLVLAVEADGKEILTIGGLGKEGKLHPIQEAFIKHFAIQCGYCTPGMILSAKALLDDNPDPAPDDIKRAISGNLCRCTGYAKIVKAIMEAAKVMKTSA